MDEGDDDEGKMKPFHEQIFIPEAEAADGPWTSTRTGYPEGGQMWEALSFSSCLQGLVIL